MKLHIKRTIDAKLSPKQIVDHILKDRKIVDIETFLHTPHPMDILFSSFFDKHHYDEMFNKTCELLTQIKQKNQTIIVYTDYDADGITGGAILWETLHLLGFKAMPYVPDRKKEGYGFSKIGIDAVKEKYNPSLIISCDHGISGHEKIKYATSLNIPIIITDHHQKLETDPKAFAIFHTDKLSGSGVAYFFAKALFEHFSSRNTTYKILNTHFRGDYLALASIGTVADLVPLTGPSRSIVAHGLLAFKSSRRVGLSNLLQEAQLAGRDISPYEIGFIIAPRINAFGRLTHAIDALRLLCTTKSDTAHELAQLAGATNKKRQDLVVIAQEQALKMVDTKQKIIILFKKEWEEGIIGLIASKMVEKFNRPAIVITGSGEIAKSSARSISGFDITGFLRSLKKHLVDVGGHKAAAGFTIETKNIKKFTKEAEKKANELLTKDDLVPSISIDLAMPLANATMHLARALEVLQPFGIGNPKPTFYSTATVLETKTIGKNKNHLKLLIKEDTSFPLEVLFFGKAQEHKDLKKGQKINTVYSLEVNRWNGIEKINGIGKHIIV